MSHNRTETACAMRFLRYQGGSREVPDRPQISTGVINTVQDSWDEARIRTRWKEAI